MKEISIDEPGAGALIMDRCGGTFREGVDHSIASYRSGKFLGGFVICDYMGNSVSVHDGAVDPTWCSRQLLWMLFHYIFRQLKCHKAYAPVPSNNYKALDMDLRAGWRFEYVLRDAIAPGRHIILLSMQAVHCPWLRVRTLQKYFPGDIVRRLASG